jgi:Leucine-rich repeat (LRR) protein
MKKQTDASKDDKGIKKYTKKDYELFKEKLDYDQPLNKYDKFVLKVLNKRENILLKLDKQSDVKYLTEESMEIIATIDESEFRGIKFYEIEIELTKEMFKSLSSFKILSFSGCKIRKIHPEFLKGSLFTEVRINNVNCDSKQLLIALSVNETIEILWIDNEHDNRSDYFDYNILKHLPKVTSFTHFGRLIWNEKIFEVFPNLEELVVSADFKNKQLNVKFNKTHSTLKRISIYTNISLDLNKHIVFFKTHLPSLEEFSYGEKTKSQSINFSLLKELRYLKKININNIRILDVNFEYLRDSSIEVLTLNNIGLNEIDLSSLKHAPTLKELRLPRNNISNIDLKPLENTNISALSLANNQLSEIDLKPLVKAKLYTLNLGSNQIKKIDLEYFDQENEWMKDYKGLMVYLTDNPFPGYEKQRLMDLYPGHYELYWKKGNKIRINF